MGDVSGVEEALLIDIFSYGRFCAEEVQAQGVALGYTVFWCSVFVFILFFRFVL